MTELCKMFCPSDLHSAENSNEIGDDKEFVETAKAEKAIDP